MRDLIAAFHKVVADVAARFDGFVAQYLGDGVRSISATLQRMSMTPSRPCAPALPSSTRSAG